MKRVFLQSHAFYAKLRSLDYIIFTFWTDVFINIEYFFLIIEQFCLYLRNIIQMLTHLFHNIFHNINNLRVPWESGLKYTCWYLGPLAG